MYALIILALLLMILSVFVGFVLPILARIWARTIRKINHKKDL